MVTVRGDPRVDPLTRRLAARLRSAEWLARGLGVLVAASGGGDSTALLILLRALADEFEWRIEVFHANHGLRGEAADRAEALVASLAAEMVLPLHVVHLDLSRTAKRRPHEQTMRIARLNALSECARAHGIAHAALGHTRDDLAETVLHRALRGAGLTGLASMRPVTEWRGVTLVRPLLGETRAALRLFLTDHGLAWDDDETNAHLDRTRNRIRHLLRPLIAREINPRADEALARLAEHAAHDDAQLEADVDAALREAALDLDVSPSLPLDWLESLSPSLRRRVLRRWLMARADSALPPSSDQIEEIVERLSHPGVARWTTFAGLQMARRGGVLSVTLPPRLESKRWPQLREAPPAASIGDEISLGRGWRLRARPIPGEEARSILREPVDRWRAVIDADALSGALTVRARRPGDRFAPLGSEHDKELRRFMTDVHLPRCVRAHLPLICDGDRIAWVAGARIADWVKITAATCRALELRFIPPAP